MTGDWVTLSDGLIESHPLYGLDDGAALLVLLMLFAPLGLLTELYGVIVPLVRGGAEGAEALWSWSTPFFVMAGLGWVLLGMLANHVRAFVWALPVWVAVALGLMLALYRDAGLAAEAYLGHLALAAAAGAAACLYAAFGPRMRVTLRRQVPRREFERLRAGPQDRSPR